MSGKKFEADPLTYCFQYDINFPPFFVFFLKISQTIKTTCPSECTWISEHECGFVFGVWWTTSGQSLVKLAGMGDRGNGSLVTEKLVQQEVLNFGQDIKV